MSKTKGKGNLTMSFNRGPDSTGGVAAVGWLLFSLFFYSGCRERPETSAPPDSASSPSSDCSAAPPADQCLRLHTMSFVQILHGEERGEYIVNLYVTVERPMPLVNGYWRVEAKNSAWQDDRFRTTFLVGRGKNPSLLAFKRHATTTLGVPGDRVEVSHQISPPDSVDLRTLLVHFEAPHCTWTAPIAPISYALLQALQLDSVPMHAFNGQRYFGLKTEEERMAAHQRLTKRFFALADDYLKQQKKNLQWIRSGN